MAKKTDITDAQLQEWNSLLSSDPELRRLLTAFNASYQTNLGAGPEMGALQAYLAQKGMTPKEHGLLLDAQTGQLKRDHTVRDNALIIGSLLVGGAGLGAAAGGASAASGAGASTATTAGAGLTGAGAGGSSIWKSLATVAAPVAGNLASQVLQTKADKEAARIQQEAADRALAEQKRIYEQSRSDSAPYRQMGITSLNRLYEGLGLTPAQLPPDMPSAPQTPASAPTQAPSAPPPTAPTQAPTNLNALAQPVTMKTPDGRTLQIPPEHVAEATQRGAVRV